MVFINENDYSFDYMLFICEQVYEQRKFNDSLCSILGESSEIITESASDKLKAFLEKVLSGVSTVATKFISVMDKLATDNNTYLEKHKKIILNKEPLKADISAFNDYDISAIKTADVPTYDESKIKTSPSEKEEFIKYFAEFSKFYQDKEKNFSDNVKFVLRGKKEPYTVQASSLDMEKMYNYVYNYNTNIKQDINESIDKLLKESKGRAFDVIAKLAKSGKNKVNSKVDDSNDKSDDSKSSDAGDKSTDTKSDNTKTSTTDTSSDTKSNKESFNYNKTLSYYFNEMDIKDAPDQEQPEKVGNVDDENGNLEDGTKMYFSLSAELLGARLNIAQEAYQNYMRIIRWHVKKYVKDDEESENKEENKETTEETKKEETKKESFVSLSDLYSINEDSLEPEEEDVRIIDIENLKPDV